MSRAEYRQSLNGTIARTLTCPQCGCDLSNHPSAQESQQRIQELEAQVRLLNEKATAAADKLADYEDEVRYLRSQRQNQQQQQQQQQQSALLNGQANHRATGSDPAAAASPPPATNHLAPTTTVNRLANLTSYLPGRRPSPLPNTSTNSNGALPSPQSPYFPPPRPPATPQNSTFPSNTTSSPSVAFLSSELANERSARQKLDAQMQAQSSEVEELTAQLFSQANEMVATERRAKAKLEERLKALEEEWKGRKERLKTLEERVGRSERIRSMLSTSDGANGTGSEAG